jgi:hypothetical protein
MTRSLKRLAAVDLTTYEGIADAMIGARADLAEALEGITDKDSAEAAKPALLGIARRESEVYAAIEELGEPEGEERRRLKAKLEPVLKKHNERVDRALDRLKADPETRAVVEAMMEDYLVATRGADASRVEDMSRMMALVHLATRAEALPLKDGAFDPYAFVGTGDITRQDYRTFRSARLGKGPTHWQIERGDYTNFPWERYRGDGSEIKKLVRLPLLWEKEPGSDGQHLVAWSDGSCRVMSPAELKAALKR